MRAAQSSANRSSTHAQNLRDIVLPQLMVITQNHHFTFFVFQGLDRLPYGGIVFASDDPLLHVIRRLVIYSKENVQHLRQPFAGAAFAQPSPTNVECDGKQPSRKASLP